MPKRRMYEYKGQTLSLKKLSEQTGIARSTLYYRIHEYGMTPDEAIAEGAGKSGGSQHLYCGEMLTVAEISSRTGVRPQTIRERLHKGWSIEEAAETLTLGVKSLVARRAAQALAGGATEDPTAGMSRAEAARYKAAKKIAAEIAGENADEFGFRCSIPMKEYLFEGDILGYRICFTPDGSSARLSARYRSEGADSDLNRLYIVHGEKIKEVQPEWTPW